MKIGDKVRVKHDLTVFVNDSDVTRMEIRGSSEYKVVGKDGHVLTLLMEKHNLVFTGHCEYFESIQEDHLVPVFSSDSSGVQDIRRMNIRPGEVLLVTLPPMDRSLEGIQEKQAKIILRAFKEVFPDTKVIIVGSDMHVVVISDKEADGLTNK
jgi:hypothetical protein